MEGIWFKNRNIHQYQLMPFVDKNGGSERKKKRQKDRKKKVKIHISGRYRQGY